MRNYSILPGGVVAYAETSVVSGVYSRVGKRLLDLSLCLLMLPSIFPVIAILWVCVRLDGGPGFFGHRRVGRNGAQFRCWKIRTMVVDAEEQLKTYLAENPDAAEEWERDHKLTNDPRINRIGRFLRKTSLDELPQIWNVLRGEMSFVGPRPIVADEIAKYGPYADHYLAQVPGITGLWQVSGRNDVTYDERVQMDVQYLEMRSFFADLSIIAQTGKSVVFRTGK